MLYTLKFPCSLAFFGGIRKNLDSYVTYEGSIIFCTLRGNARKIVKEQLHSSKNNAAQDCKADRSRTCSKRTYAGFETVIHISESQIRT